MKRTPMPPRAAHLKRGTPIRAKGGSRFPNQRQPKYTAWIKRRHCIMEFVSRSAGCSGPIDPAHVNQTRAQGAPDLGEVVPLCRRHHEEQEGRTGAFNKRYGLNLSELATSYASRFLAYHPECGAARLAEGG